MNKAEAKELMTKYLLPVIEKHGYKEKKSKSSDFQFAKKTAMGEDLIIGGFTDYNPVQQVVYSLMKRHKAILDLLLQLQDSGTALVPKITNITATIGISYTSLNNLDTLNFMPQMQTEDDVRNSVALMVSFMEDTAFPLMDKFEDLREIDKIINGETPWTSDWKMPYPFGGHFHLKRLIIARLAGLGNYARVLDFVRQDYTSHFNDEYGDSYKLALQQAEKLNELLVNVKPLY